MSNCVDNGDNKTKLLIERGQWIDNDKTNRSEQLSIIFS